MLIEARPLSALSAQIEKTASRLSAKVSLGRADHSRQFEGLMALLSARIAGLVRQYRLGDMREDAQQAAAIGVHRALETFDPTKASFATHVTWQIRGELQSLRHRMRLDHRVSAKSAGAKTVSLEALSDGLGDSAVFEFVDETALKRSERAASDEMATAFMDRLLDQLEAPEQERALLHDHLFDREPTNEARSIRTSEQRRQIVRRTLRNCAKVAAAA
ncbi:sigma factor [uncultured Erythrobacter sp.]|uniref:sigma factor n=1 Tax=uncultured Erythrobacter sp. TaxID=263913 RepID=UPI0026051EFE|nr:sigma factor [uncultured Erythrobacter sp.]